MTTQKRQRRKGGGRKFMDGRMTERQFQKKIDTYFYYDAGMSIKKFLLFVKVSRQAYYRFLSNNPDIKLEIDGLIAKNHMLRKSSIKIMDSNLELKPVEIKVMDLDIELK